MLRDRDQDIFFETVDQDKIKMHKADARLLPTLCFWCDDTCWTSYAVQFLGFDTTEDS